MALHHTNRDLFHIIPLTPDQASSACYARYLAEFANLCSKDHQGLCTTCQDLQPLASFSISEVMALERQQHARCLRHSQLWMCPHVSYDYNMIMELGRTGRWIKIHNYTGFPNCGSTRCSHIFRHEFTPDQTSFLDDSIQSTITISEVEHHSGPGMIRDTIRRYFTKARLQTATNMIRAPICDHHLLSDGRVRDTYDPADIDIYDWAWMSVNDALKSPRTVRQSDGSCSFCHALGGQTRFRFVVTIMKSYSSHSWPGKASIKLEAVVIRSVGPTTFGQEEAHFLMARDQGRKYLRCYGITERRLAKFQNAWAQVPKDFPATSADDAVDSQHPAPTQVLGDSTATSEGDAANSQHPQWTRLARR